jgi:hypothetical protein
MHKAHLERFISKYNLSGASESVEVTMAAGKLSTRFIVEDRNCVGFISTDKVELEDGVYRIMHTASLRKLLGVLGDGIAIAVKKINGSPIAFVISDGRNKVTFTLSDITPTVPVPADVPDWDVEIAMDQAFMSSFIRATGAMTEAEYFTVLCDGKTAEVVLGHSSEYNSNSVTLKVDATKLTELRAMNFSSRYLREVLAANKESQTGTMKVTEHGAIFLTFDLADYKAEYWIMELS